MFFLHSPVKGLYSLWLWTLFVAVLAATPAHARGLRCSEISLPPTYASLPMLPEYFTRDQGDLNATYLKGLERIHHEIHIEDGLLKWADGSLVNAEADEIVMDEFGRIYAENPNYKIVTEQGRRSFHSSFFAGAPVAMAGTFACKQGIIEWISNASGHYSPPVEMLIQIRQELVKRGALLQDLKFYNNSAQMLELPEGESPALRAVHTEKIYRTLDSSAVKALPSYRRSQLKLEIKWLIEDRYTDERIFKEIARKFGIP